MINGVSLTQLRPGKNFDYLVSEDGLPFVRQNADHCSFGGTRNYKAIEIAKKKPKTCVNENLSQSHTIG